MFKKIIYWKGYILMKFTFFRFIGIEVLKKLYALNLSHNSISRIENLVRSTSLVELNLSMNELEDISYMPSMMNLQVLNLNNNKVGSTFFIVSKFLFKQTIHSVRCKLEWQKKPSCNFCKLKVFVTSMFILLLYYMHCEMVILSE